MISGIRATPVRVPARPDSLNSPEVDDADTEFARRFHTGKRWTGFPDEIKWIVELKDSSGLLGVGETYRGASAESVAAAFRPLMGCDVLRLNWRNLPVYAPRVYDAVESAVLDLAGKILGLPAYQLLGGAVRDSVECSGWTGRRTPRDAARKAREALDRGHKVFKFKCAFDDRVAEWAQAIESVCGSSIRLLLDPNQRWSTVENTLHIMHDVPRHVMFGLEDPIDRSDLAGLRVLRERLDIPIFVHVSLPYSQPASDVVNALREGAVDGFNFNGSMFGFVDLAAAASFGGVPCWHGSEVDLGILEASALHACAAAQACALPSDIFGELVREDDLIVEPLGFENGSFRVPSGPGLGIELDQAALQRYGAGEVLQ